MPYEKVVSKPKAYKVESLRYPSERTCTSCGTRHRDLWAVWWYKPNKPADPPKDLYCFKCYYETVDQQPDLDHLFYR